jgi:hypothetical protein
MPRGDLRCDPLSDLARCRRALEGVESLLVVYGDRPIDMTGEALYALIRLILDEFDDALHQATQRYQPRAV